MTPEERRDLANEAMFMTDACRYIGMDVPYSMSGSYKLWCPFGGLVHEDDRSFRIYQDTNSAYCFACGTAFTPVTLISMAKDVTIDNAVQTILEETNYVPPTFDAQWDAMEAKKEEIETSYLAEALKVFCSGISLDWEERQFDPEVSSMYARCTALLPTVHTREDANKWLTATKTIMERTLGVDNATE